MIVNQFSSVNNNFITSGNLGIGLKEADSLLHLKNHNSYDSPFIICNSTNSSKKPLISLIKKNNQQNINPTIEGISNKGSSQIQIGKDVKIINNNDNGLIYLSSSLSNFENKNLSLGSDLFRVQIMDGGLYIDGDSILKSGKSYGTNDNFIGNNAAILKTGYKNSNFNQISFNWRDNILEAIPFINGNPDTKNKVSVKNFCIEHPCNKEKYLVHACIEGVKADVFYRGTAVLNYKSKKCVVELPDWFSKLVDIESTTIQITPVNKYIKLFLNIDNLKDNYFNIIRDGPLSYEKDNIKIFWEVKASRKNSFSVEPYKKDVKVNGFGPYTFFE